MRNLFLATVLSERPDLSYQNTNGNVHVFASNSLCHKYAWISDLKSSMAVNDTIVIQYQDKTVYHGPHCELLTQRLGGAIVSENSWEMACSCDKVLALVS